MQVLVTGGTGFIGSHTCVELLNAGYEVVVADNYCNSSPEAIRRVEEITGKPVQLYEADIRDGERLSQIFRENKIDRTADEYALELEERKHETDHR